MSENPYGDGVLRVSEISGAFKPDIEGLLFWAAKNGWDYKKDRDSACDIGNAVHQFAEATLSCDMEKAAKACVMFDELTPSEQRKASNARQAFMEWASVRNIVPSYLEEKMTNYDGLYSEELGSDMPKIGGTVDFIGYVNTRFVMIDWKSSRHLSKAYGVQLAGYKYLFELNYPDAPKIESYYGLRLDKEMAFPEEYDYTPWIEEAEQRFITQAKLLGKWPNFTTLDY